MYARNFDLQFVFTFLNVFPNSRSICTLDQIWISKQHILFFNSWLPQGRGVSRRQYFTTITYKKNSRLFSYTPTHGHWIILRRTKIDLTILDLPFLEPTVYFFGTVKPSYRCPWPTLFSIQVGKQCVIFLSIMVEKMPCFIWMEKLFTMFIQYGWKDALFYLDDGTMC
jgi:hypothetical protein